MQNRPMQLNTWFSVMSMHHVDYANCFFFQMSVTVGCVLLTPVSHTRRWLHINYNSQDDVCKFHTTFLASYHNV